MSCLVRDKLWLLEIVSIFLACVATGVVYLTGFSLPLATAKTRHGTVDTVLHNPLSPFLMEYARGNFIMLQNVST